MADDDSLFGFGVLPTSPSERRLEARRKKELEREQRRARREPDLSPDCRRCAQAAINSMGNLSKARVTMSNLRREVENHGEPFTGGKVRLITTLEKLKRNLERVEDRCGLDLRSGPGAAVGPLVRVEETIETLRDPTTEIKPKGQPSDVDILTLTDRVRQDLVDAFN